MAIYTYQFVGSGVQGSVEIPELPLEYSEVTDPMDLDSSQATPQEDIIQPQDSMLLDDRPSNTSCDATPDHAIDPNLVLPKTDLVPQEEQGSIENTGSLWFDRLPAELRIHILEYLFGDDQFEHQLEEERFWEIDTELEEVDKLEIYPNYNIDIHAAVFRLPSFRNLFASHDFLKEALPVYARMSYTYLVWLMEPVIFSVWPYSTPDSMFQTILVDTWSMYRSIVIRTDDWRSWYVNAGPVMLSCFPQLMRIDVVCPYGLVLADDRHLAVSSHGHFTRRPVNAADLLDFMAPKWVLTTLEVRQLVSCLILPPGIRASLSCTRLMNNLDPEEMEDHRLRRLRFREASTLAWMLKTRGWEGTVFYHVEFECRMEVEGSDHPKAVTLKLKIDLSEVELVKAVFTM